MTGLATSTSPRCDVLRREALTPRDRDEMFALLGTYFANVRRDVFDRDLGEKEWVILLRDDGGRVDGFSTLMTMNAGGATVFFSGDTIVDRGRWGSADLPRTWSRHVFTLAEELRTREAYWFLISSGFRTYRYLPLFFRDFYPAAGRATPPAMKALLDRIARAKFGDSYDAETGVVRLATPAPLRAGVSDPDARAARDPHVAFFLEANSGHGMGDELACLVRIDRDNLTPAGRRMLR